MTARESREPEAWTDPRLAGTRFDDVRWFSFVDSTNRYLLQCAAQGAPEGVVAVADEQTAGRGRLGRTWVAPAGSALLVSVLLRPELPLEATHLVTLAAGLAALDAIDVLASVPAGLKWPNDVVIDDRKIAGILAEADGAGAVVVGMGCNVVPGALAPELRDIATAVPLDRGGAAGRMAPRIRRPAGRARPHCRRRDRAFGDDRPAGTGRARARDVRGNGERLDRRGVLGGGRPDRERGRRRTPSPRRRQLISRMSPGKTEHGDVRGRDRARRGRRTRPRAVG